jgi:poly-gamma-glutamate synthesis protein (capsule biosynthesis protein)
VIPQSLVSEIRAADSIRNAGFNLLSLANNHIMDHGPEGLRSTRKALGEAGLGMAGAGEDLDRAREPFVADLRGIRVGLLAYTSSKATWASEETPGAAPMVAGIVEEDIRRLREEVDVVLLSLHFGLMYTDYPQIDDQRMLRRWIDAGAAVILGHHPHVCQGIEEYGGGVIAYSLGEFVFDPRAGNVLAVDSLERRRKTMIFTFELDRGGLVSWDLVPVRIGDDLIPAIARDEEAAAIRGHFESISAPLQGDGLSKIDVDMHTGSRIVAHEIRVVLFHLKRFHLGYFLKRLFRVRPRHLKMALGWIRHRITGSRGSS